MALKSAYNYVRENIDSNFDKYVADNVSYGCEEDIEDIKRWISEEGEDAQVALYYAQHEGAYVFNDFDIYVEGMDFTYDNYLITTLKKALAVLELQDEMFDNISLSSSYIYFAQMDSFPEFVRTFHSHEDSVEPANFK